MVHESITLGDSLIEKSAYEPARTAYQSAIDYFKSNNNWEEFYEAKLKYVLTFREEGKSERSFDELKALLPDALKQLPPNSEVLASYFHKKGLLLYESGQDSLAVEYYRKALNIRNKKEKKELIKIARGNTNIGLSYYYLNKLDSADFYLNHAKDIITSNNIKKDDGLSLLIYQQLAIIAEQDGDIDKVIQFMQYLINFYENKQDLTKNEYYNQALAYDTYARSLSKLYQFEQALSLFDKAKKCATKYAEKATDLSGTISYNLGNAYLDMQDYENAEKELKKALTIYQRVSAKYKVEDALLRIGVCYNEQKKHQESIAILASLLFESEDPADRKFLSQVYDNLGAAYRGLGQLDKAIEHYNKSIALIVKDYKENYHFEPPKVANIIIDKRGILTTLYYKAIVLSKTYELQHNLSALKAAFSHYQTADSLITNIRQDFLAEGSKISLVAETKPIYEKAIKVSYELWKQTNEEQYKTAMLNFVESSKAIVLLEAVRGAKASKFAGIDNSLEKKLNLEIRRVKEQLFSSPNDALELEKQLIELELQKEKFVKDLEENHPNYFNYKFQSRTPTVAALQKLIGTSTTLLEYFVGDSSSYALIITQKEGLQVHKLPLTKKQLADWIAVFNQAIYQPFSEATDPVNLTTIDSVYAHLGHQLYQQLIYPLDLKSQQNLIIIPDELLNLLPYDALLSSEVPANFYGYYGNPQAYAYLLYEYPISYCYSSSLLLQMHLPTNFKNKPQLLAFNNPEFATQITALENSFGWNQQFLFSLQEASTRNNFQALAAQYQFLHFSTHGVINNQEPEQSHLVLNAKQEQERPLYLSTLYTTPLHAELVVTSACDAGIGKVSSGEGILSLARGFSYAGVRSIITSLWTIKDGPTSKIISQFYTYLQANLQKDKALQNAKIAYVKGHDDNLARPYYWAGFIPIGNMDAVSIPFVMPFWLKIFCGIGVLGICVFLFKH